MIIANILNWKVLVDQFGLVDSTDGKMWSAKQMNIVLRDKVEEFAKQPAPDLKDISMIFVQCGAKTEAVACFRLIKYTPAKAREKWLPLDNDVFDFIYEGTAN